jgi:SOS-response transcriptional repressor LexA
MGGYMGKTQGEIIKELREKAGLSKSALVRKTDNQISWEYISKLEKGAVTRSGRAHILSWTKAEILALALGVSPQVFFPSAESEPPAPKRQNELAPTDDLKEMVMLRRRGSINAGMPETADAELQEIYDPFPAILLRAASPATYSLKVLGDSLAGDGLHRGDVVAVDPKGQIIDGKIYAIRCPDTNETVARHMKRINGKVHLSSSDGVHEDIELDQVEVLGRIVARFNWGLM